METKTIEEQAQEILDKLLDNIGSTMIESNAKANSICLEYANTR